MTTDRKSYTEEFKREAIRLLESSGNSITQLARDLEINDNNLYRWRGLYSSPSEDRATGNDGKLFIAHHPNRGSVLRQYSIKSQLILTQS